jgi:Ca2+-binding EF-hand superfamily protein
MSKKVASSTRNNNRFQALSNEEMEEIKQAFDLFDTNNTGKINPAELKQAMQSLGFNDRNPTIFSMICDLDTPQNAKNGGIDLDTFVDAINNKLGDKESDEGIRRIFQLFTSDPNATSIDASDLHRIARELGETMTKEELNDMLKRASSSGNSLSFNEFRDIMTKKTFP